MTKNCLFCNNTITLIKKTAKEIERKKFCCRKCLYEYMKVNSPDKKPRKEIFCSFCNKSLNVINTSKKKFCSNQCAKKGKIIYHPTKEHKETISKSIQNAWINGSYNKKKAGRTKWYKYKRKDGTEINVQGTWELKYAIYLEENNINFICHQGYFEYIDENGNNKIYLPDFYLPETNIYIDIKNDYLYNKSVKKINLVRACNPNLNLLILLKKDLNDMGIKL
jgi:hypothetical protein